MSGKALRELGFEAHGVRFALGGSDDELLGRLADWLPPGAKACPPESAERRFAVVADDDLGYRMKITKEADASCADLGLAIGTLQRRVGLYVASRAQDHVFIHAGAVTHRGRAIVLPGHSMSGKTTLVTALVENGASFYSDEYAVLDERGLVHSYAQPLSVRDEEGQAHIQQSEGADGAESPVPVGLVALATYRAGAEWSPQARTTGAGLIALLAHALSLEERPADTLATARSALESAVILEGERGEAAVVAPALLEALA